MSANLAAQLRGRLEGADGGEIRLQGSKYTRDCVAA
jgi:hypothetical protein